MAFLILVFGETVFKQFWLPKEKNQSYTAVLYKEYFRLSKTTYLKLKNTEGDWYFNGEKMQIGKQYEITIEKEEKVTICLVKKTEFSFYKKYNLKDKFHIGRGKDNDFVIRCSEEISRRHAVIVRTEEDQREIINNSINGLYVNGIFVKEKRKLNYGDLIYIPGMYVVFLGNYIAAEMKESDSSGEDREQDEIQKVRVLPPVKSKKIIAVSDVFHRAPRFMEEIEKTSIEIDAPPNIKEREKESIFMKLGAVLNMTLPMLIMNLFMIYAMKIEHQEVGVYIYMRGWLWQVFLFYFL